MAGGKHAKFVACMKCAGKAQRTSEGLETDWYKCTECSNKFGITWEEIPYKPQWPISDEQKNDIKSWHKKVHDNKKGI